MEVDGGTEGGVARAVEDWVGTDIGGLDDDVAGAGVDDGGIEGYQAVVDVHELEEDSPVVEVGGGTEGDVARAVVVVYWAGTDVANGVKDVDQIDASDLRDQ